VLGVDCARRRRWWCSRGAELKMPSCLGSNLNLVPSEAIEVTCKQNRVTSINYTPKLHSDSCQCHFVMYTVNIITCVSYFRFNEIADADMFPPHLKGRCEFLRNQVPDLYYI
jgi:hypothetical protein